MAGKELPSRKAKEIMLFQWKQDTKTAYDACLPVKNNIIRAELGTLDSPGRLDAHAVDALVWQFKIRIINLRNSVERCYKLPEYIEVGPSLFEGDDRKAYFWTNEGRLVLAPMVEEIVVFKPKKFPDFQRKQDAPEWQWIVASAFLPQHLLDRIPSKIRSYIKGAAKS